MESEANVYNVYPVVKGPSQNSNDIHHVNLEHLLLALSFPRQMDQGYATRRS